MENLKGEFNSTWDSNQIFSEQNLILLKVATKLVLFI